MEDNGNFEKGQDDGFTQANTYQNTQQNLAQMHSQSTESASGFAIAGMICGILSIWMYKMALSKQKMWF